MYFKLFSQGSIEVIVSLEESDHSFGALCEVITTVHAITNSGPVAQRGG